MQLNEILDENTISAISKKTNISEDNIDALMNADFDKIKRVKAMGFISILEREYKADLSKFKEDALAYYNQQKSDESVTLGIPMPAEEKKGKSKFLMFVVILLIIYAIWYAFTNLDKEKLSAMLPFSEETLSRLMTSDKSMNEEIKDANSLRIENVKPVESETVPESETHTTNDDNRSY